MENEKEFYTNSDYHEAHMSELERFVNGEISLSEVTENAVKFSPPTLIEFVEKISNVKLEHWQKTLLMSLYHGNKISFTSGRRYGKKILVDGVKEYKRQIENG